MAFRVVLAVEHLVREDYKIEAMDRIEAYMDTLLMRLTLIKDRPCVFVSAPRIDTGLISLQEEWLGGSGN